MNATNRGRVSPKDSRSCGLTVTRRLLMGLGVAAELAVLTATPAWADAWRACGRPSSPNDTCYLSWSEGTSWAVEDELNMARTTPGLYGQPPRPWLTDETEAAICRDGLANRSPVNQRAFSAGCTETIDAMRRN